FEGDDKDNPYSYIQWYPKNTNRYTRLQQQRLNELNTIGEEFSRQFTVPMVNDRNKRLGHWFFDVDQQIFKYYSVSGKGGEYLGANGFVDTPSEAVKLQDCRGMELWLKPNSYDPMIIYQTLHAVYQIDFQQKEIRTLAETEEDPIRVVMQNNWKERHDYENRPTLTILTNSNQLYLYLKNPDQVIRTQLPADFTDFAIPQFVANDKTIYAKYTDFPETPCYKDREAYTKWYRENFTKPTNRRVRLFEVSPAGEFTETSSFAWTQPGRNPNIVYQDGPRAFNSAVNSVSSPIPMWLTWKFLRTQSYRQWSEMGREMMNFIRAYSEVRLSINLCVMTAFAALTVWHGWPRRTHIAKLIFWTTFVFLFNLPGFLTYLAFNHTPIISCAACGKKRGLAQNSCRACSAALPQPERKETDLLMPLPA
ncbi:MAG: hypothetical protein ACYTET_07175, partial [Planctomycetota bacterium]